DVVFVGDRGQLVRGDLDAIHLAVDHGNRRYILVGLLDALQRVVVDDQVFGCKGIAVAKGVRAEANAPQAVLDVVVGDGVVVAPMKALGGPHVGVDVNRD